MKRACRSHRLSAWAGVLLSMATASCSGQQAPSETVSPESSAALVVDEALMFLEGDERTSKVSPTSSSTIDVARSEPACGSLETAEDIPPEEYLERVSKCLRTAQNEIARDDVPLDGVVSLPDEDQEVIFADSGREIWFKGSDGEAWHIALEGSRLPDGTRLVPATDLDLMGPAIFPGGYAVLHPSSSKAWLVDHPGVGAMSFPLERAPQIKGKVLNDADALANTVTLRYLKTCPSGQSECLLFGPLEDVEAARDPAEPPGSWNLKTFVGPPLPENLSWEPHPIKRRQGFDGGAYISVVVRSGDTKGATIEVERAEFAHEKIQYWAFRLWLVVHDQRERALDLTFVDRIGFSVGLYGDSKRLRVATGTSELRASVSIHDRRTGKRIGKALQVEAEPYHNICLAGDYGIYLYDVHTRGAPGFALSFEGSQEVALYFERPDHPGKQVKVRLPPGFQPYEQVITKVTYRRGSLHPTVETLTP